MPWKVYSDAVRTEGPLKEWAQDLSPRRRAKTHVTEALSRDMDEWFVRWGHGLLLNEECLLIKSSGTSIIIVNGIVPNPFVKLLHL